MLVDGVKDYALFTVDARDASELNSAPSACVGYTEAEIVGESFSRFFIPADVKKKNGEPEKELRERRVRAGGG